MRERVTQARRGGKVTKRGNVIEEVSKRLFQER